MGLYWATIDEALIELSYQYLMNMMMNFDLLKTANSHVLIFYWLINLLSSTLTFHFDLRWPQFTSFEKVNKVKVKEKIEKKDSGFGFGLFYVGWVEPYSDNSPLWRVLTIGEGSNVTQYRIQHSLPNIIAALSKILNSSPFR